MFQGLSWHFAQKFDRKTFFQLELSRFKESEVGERSKGDREEKKVDVMGGKGFVVRLTSE